MRKIYILAIALLVWVSCQEKEQPSNPKLVPKPKSELEQKAGWILGKWGKIGEKAQMAHFWKKIDDSTFRCEITANLAFMPDSTRPMKMLCFLKKRNDTIWMIHDEGERKWRDIAVSSTPNSLSFKSLDNGDLETITFHGDSITSDNTYKHNIKQRFVKYRLK